MPTERDVAYPVEGGFIYFSKSTGTIIDCNECAFHPADDTVCGLAADGAVISSCQTAHYRLKYAIGDESPPYAHVAQQDRARAS